MREWYDSLEPREKLIVGVGIVVTAAMLYFGMVWDPLQQSAARLQTESQEARSLVRYMQQVAAEARQYAGQPRSGGNPNSNRSLLAVVDGTGKQAGLGEVINRIQPEGDATVRLWLEDAPFEEVMRWLNQLDTQHAISLDSGSLDRDDAAGTVKARLTLKRSDGA